MHGSLPTELLLNAYRDGIFPMAEDADDPNFAFFQPVMRAQVPIQDLHISRSLRKALKQRPYRVTMDQAFEDIIDGCALKRDKHEGTWINIPIRDFFVQLHKEGHAHSIECWDKDGSLAGGLYGLAIGAVFCGESMVSFQTNASKIALVHLCALLWKNDYSVLDSQFINPHMEQFGTYEIPQEDYEALIKIEMKKERRLETADFDALLKDYLVNVKVAVPR
jgi:leucyl/phenylalanyl-tRNA--protein transferase